MREHNLEGVGWRSVTREGKARRGVLSMEWSSGGGPLGGEEEERQGASAWRWGWKDGGGTQG